MRVVNSCMFKLTMKKTQKSVVCQKTCAFFPMKANEVEQKISTALSSPLKRLRLRRLRFSSDADIVRLTNARIIIIIIIIIIIMLFGLNHEYLYRNAQA